ncbi:MAG TPA: cyanophycinase [Fimbriiglobus sp.]|jgi:cyanophycinase
MPPRIAGLLLLAFAPAAFGQAVPALPPLDIAGLPGKLVIVGGGTMPDAVRTRFVALAGGKEKAAIVVIPTASADADDPAKADSFLAAWKKLEPASVVLLHTRDRKTANDTKFCAPLDSATAVWFSGGDQSKLVAAYAGTLVGKKLHALFARGGVIGGTSAGAAVMSDVMITGGNPKAAIAAGFGFLPGFVVDQHFVKRDRKARLVGVLDAHPGYVGLGIDEGTAAVCSGRRMTVLGESTVTVILSPGAGKQRSETVLRARGIADLVQLRRAAANRAAADPFPPKSPPVPFVAKGTLVIVGGGGTTNEIMDTFFEKAGGKDALVVCIPTATETDAVPADPGDAKYLRRWGGTNVKVLHTRDRKLADDPKFSDILLKAGGVWFGGGRQWRIVDSYEGTLTQKRIADVLARGGVIGGSSAGASIQSEYMPRGHPLGNTVMAAEGYERGFAYLPGAAVDQHFITRKRFNDLNGLVKLYPQYLGIGIDEATAIVVTGSIAKVMGKSKVNFLDASKDPKKPTVTELQSGDFFDLKERKKIEP